MTSMTSYVIRHGGNSMVVLPWNILIHTCLGQFFNLGLPLKYASVNHLTYSKWIQRKRHKHGPSVYP